MFYQGALLITADGRYKVGDIVTAERRTTRQGEEYLHLSDGDGSPTTHELWGIVLDSVTGTKGRSNHRLWLEGEMAFHRTVRWYYRHQTSWKEAHLLIVRDSETVRVRAADVNNNPYPEWEGTLSQVVYGSREEKEEYFAPKPTAEEISQRVEREAELARFLLDHEEEAWDWWRPIRDQVERGKIVVEHRVYDTLAIARNVADDPFKRPGTGKFIDLFQAAIAEWGLKQ
jgi:hypothetical protein